MLALALTTFFGIAAIGSIAVIWDSIHRGLAAAQAIRSEIERIDRRGMWPAEQLRAPMAARNSRPAAPRTARARLAAA
jgi:hypothetical protein